MLGMHGRNPCLRLIGTPDVAVDLLVDHPLEGAPEPRADFPQVFQGSVAEGQPYVGIRRVLLVQVEIGPRWKQQPLMCRSLRHLLGGCAEALEPEEEALRPAR